MCDMGGVVDDYYDQTQNQNMYLTSSPTTRTFLLVAALAFCCQFTAQSASTCNINDLPSHCEIEGRALHVGNRTVIRTRGRIPSTGDHSRDNGERLVTPFFSRQRVLGDSVIVSHDDATGMTTRYRLGSAEAHSARSATGRALLSDRYVYELVPGESAEVLVLSRSTHLGADRERLYTFDAPAGARCRLLNMVEGVSSAGEPIVTGIYRVQHKRSARPEYFLFCCSLTEPHLLWKSKEWGLNAEASDDGNFCIIGGVVVVIAERRIAAFELASGEPRWEIVTTQSVQSSSCDASGERIYYSTSGSGLIAIDANTGLDLWQHNAVKPWCGDVQVTPNGRLFALCQSSAQVYELERHTGEIIWSSAAQRTHGRIQLTSLGVSESFVTFHDGAFLYKKLIAADKMSLKG